MSDKLEQEKTAIEVCENEVQFLDDSHGPEPTAQDWKTLREVSDKIPVSAYLVIVIEFCERFTYYGLSGPFQNYIQYPPPPSCKCFC
jgi:POT family proton-dependent oligopeptide transporter